MSKKDYQTIARALHSVSRRIGQLAQIQWYADVEAMADVLAADNPRFDRARFIEACETGTTKGMKRGAL